jgi:hypothetical protein
MKLFLKGVAMAMVLAACSQGLSAQELAWCNDNFMSLERELIDRGLTSSTATKEQWDQACRDTFEQSFVVP